MVFASLAFLFRMVLYMTNAFKENVMLNKNVFHELSLIVDVHCKKINVPIICIYNV